MMKGIAGLMCFSSLNAGALWIEYQTAVLVGTGCFFFAAGSALALLTAALLLAPEGQERPDGFHSSGIGGRAYFVTSDSLNQRVRDNEIGVAARKPIPTEHS
jgi:hypothetical protein